MKSGTIGFIKIYCQDDLFISGFIVKQKVHWPSLRSAAYRRSRPSRLDALGLLRALKVYSFSKLPRYDHTDTKIVRDMTDRSLRSLIQRLLVFDVHSMSHIMTIIFPNVLCDSFKPYLVNIATTVRFKMTK